jgi:hypothetical protein
MLNLAAIASDLNEIIDDLPVTCNALGQAFNATSSDDSENRQIEIDGTYMDVDRVIVVNSLNLPEGLKADDPITVGGKAYRILNFSDHQDGVGVEIRLKANVR